MDQAIRNRLRGVVTQCRKLLEDSTDQALQGRFGIFAARKKGEVQIEDESRMAHLTDEDRACRQDLLDHLKHIQAIGYKPSEALNQLVREIAFTHLNRLCAYKMMEARGLIREAVSRGLKSQGFFFYLADHPDDEKLHNNGRQEVSYQNFLDWLGVTFSQEIGVLFNPNDPANRIYPPQRVLDDVLALINDKELEDIWVQDETIGWVYQYFTPKELRDKARKESQAPRNSYELAFRNQFFTPRYVVEFLTDNTLGRIWYEMRKGKTILNDRCRFLVRRPTEIFLREGEEPPAETKDAHEDLSQEELLKQPVYIPHRPKKDPREIKILDPACGSGHFLLYCFDLLQVIYEEAYDDPNLSATLRSDYPGIEDLRRVVPGLILKHNLHGIDIDLRATQIAALALWLSCQRAYQELGLKDGERPKITRSNIVCAEPMPGETDLLKEFTVTLQPKVLGQLVEAVFEKMKLAGEAGSLLKIEEEILNAAMTAKQEYQEELRRQREQAGYLPGMAPPKERTLFDFSDMTESEFLDRAEEEIIVALSQYAEKASNGRGFRRRLFTEDAARGFSFVDLCSKKYDVVLMNPPFGSATNRTKSWFRNSYPEAGENMSVGSIQQSLKRLSDDGFVGLIGDLPWLQQAEYAKFREKLMEKEQLRLFAELGWGILGTDVEVAVAVFTIKKAITAIFTNLVGVENQSDELIKAFRDTTRFVIRNLHDFSAISNCPFAYQISDVMLDSFKKRSFLSHTLFEGFGGVAASEADRVFRCWWEVESNDIGRMRPWTFCQNGTPYSPLYYPTYFVIRSDAGNFTTINSYPNARTPNIEKYWKPGLAYGKRTWEMYTYPLPAEQVITWEGQALFPISMHYAWHSLALTNSSLYSQLSNLVAGQHKYAGYLNTICLDISRLKDLSDHAISGYQSVHNIDELNELSHAFVPFTLVDGYAKHTLEKLVSEAEDNIAAQLAAIDAAVFTSVAETSYGKRRPPSGGSYLSVITDSESSPNTYTKFLFSFIIGCIFGRWDILFTTGEHQPAELPDPFDPLPVCPPGMLQGPDGLPAKSEDVPSNYPLRIDWDGILVDNPGHEDDIVLRVRDVLEVIWNDCTEAIEREACEILGVRELREYFRKPGNGSFWVDHVKRYSKSRRKAPIYWYLRSAKGNYGLWLYYHRLDKDILFKALLNYVEPKIRLEEDRLKNLRARKEAAGSSGREAKQIEKDLDRQEQFDSELRDFEDKLHQAANLHLDPDLNDGVVLNIAPLWELVPWKEAKEYWDDLVEGKYAWSSIGKQLQEKGLVKK